MPAPKSSAQAVKRAKDESVVERTLEEKSSANSSTPSSLKRPILPFLPEQGFIFYFLIILLAATVILVISFFLMDSNYLPNLFNKNNNSQTLNFDEHLQVLSNKIETSGEDMEFTNSIKGKLNILPQTQDREAQYQSLFQIAVFVGSRYSETNKPILREFMQELDIFVSQNFSDHYKKSDFYTACVDTQCSNPIQPSEISEIREMMENTDLGINKQNMLSAIDNAAFAREDEAERRFSSYLFVYQILKKEAQKGNGSAGEIASDLGVFLQKEYKNFWEEVQKVTGGI